MSPDKQPTNSMPPLGPNDPLQGSGTQPPQQPNAAVPPIVPTALPSAESISEYNPAAFSQPPADFLTASVAEESTPSGSPYPVQPSLPGNPGGPPPPPPPPQVPFFLDPRGPYAQIGRPQPPPKSRKVAKFVLVFTVLFIFMIGGFIYLQAQGGGGDSSDLFKAALANMYSTNNLTQKTTIDQDSIELKQDVSDTKNPKLSGTINLASQNAKIEGYATLANSYVKYDEPGKLKTAASTDDSLVKGKWVQIRNNTKLPSQYAPEASLEGLFDPRMSLYGGMVFGNFTPSDQQALLNDVQASGVYSVDGQSAQASAVNGEAVSEFEVKVNATALKAFNKKAGQMAGISETDLDAAIEAADFDTYAKAKIVWSISTDNQRLVRVTVTEDGQTTVTDYSGYGATQVDDEPKADIQYADFQTLFKGAAAAAQATTPEDQERNADVVAIAGYLEKYYDTYKFYPSLSNVNDATWVAANLPGIPDATLRDPKGTASQFAASPTVNQYSYQVYKDKSLAACDGVSCQHFKVSATYTDGTVFSQESVR